MQGDQQSHHVEAYVTTDKICCGTYHSSLYITDYD
jgi:hypothetical protein